MLKINDKVTKTYSNANPLKRASFVVNRKEVFKYLRALNERSFVAVVTGPLVNIFFLPYLYFIHEKASCIAIFWTGRPHSLGSCHLKENFQR